MLHARQIGRRQVELPRGARDFHQVERIDDAGSPPRETPLDGLRVFEVGIHAGFPVDEPCAQVPGGMVRVPALARELVSGRQRGHDEAQPDHGAAVLDKIIRIAHAVALDVRAAGVLWIGPPVVAFGEEIVPAAGAARGYRGGNGHRLFGEAAVRAFQHAGAFDEGEVEPFGAAAVRRGGQSNGGLEKIPALHG